MFYLHASRWSTTPRMVRVLLCVAALIAAGSAFGDGYRNPPPTAEGIGKGGANRAFVDDASAIFYNPANLMFLERPEVVGGVTIARAHGDFDPDNLAGSRESEDPWQAMPNVFAAWPMPESGLVFGLGISTPYGQSVEWDRDAFYAPMTPSLYRAEMKMVDFAPTAAWKLNDNLFFGAGVNIMYSTFDLDQNVPWSDLPSPPFTGPDSTGEIESDGMGLGGNAGMTWLITERQRMAFTYRSRFQIEYDGDLHVGNFQPGGYFAAASSDFSTDIQFPDTFALGYGVRVTDRMNLECNVEWLNWSSNDEAVFDLGNNGSLPVNYDWEDTFTYALGADWSLDDHWTARFGYAYIESPVPDHTYSPFFLEEDRHVLSTGIGYRAGGHRIDLAYAYSLYDERDVNTNTENPLYEGEYEYDSDLLGLTYAYTF
ncbi:OmpP1/FadL family transporter [Kiritimatiella glycovorans]|uniref:Fatty acid transporter membrane protein n=1 Tax=Kiritimatiella glycovorans TaxID=1307763 RepID=A0A0G3EFY6_9BACT|nr:outer membrane protein transport protein [Kiritimatiella glycovorans]AKJ65336.1 Putative fatty acid transporter membrane protein [Kiritimatiella glycovorans]